MKPDETIWREILEAYAAADPDAPQWAEMNDLKERHGSAAVLVNLRYLEGHGMLQNVEVVIKGDLNNMRGLEDKTWGRHITAKGHDFLGVRGASITARGHDLLAGLSAALKRKEGKCCHE